MYKNTKHISFIVVITFVILSIMWMMQLSNSLIFDDYTNIATAKFTSYNDLFRPLPTNAYADRPMGLMFIKVLYDLFELNYQMYHMVFCLIHILNVIILYNIVLMLFRNEEESKKYALSSIAAAVFGVYPITLMAVSWISAVYDLLCCFFVLLSINFYVKSENEEYKDFYGILILFFYYLSLRSKEMSLTLPVIFWIYEFYKVKKEKKNIRISWTLLVSTFFMFIYTCLLFLGGLKNITVDNPYHQNFNLGIMIRNAFRYAAIYFDLSSSSFIFERVSKFSIIGFIFLSLIVLTSLYLVKKNKDFALLSSFLCIGVSLAVVLPMENMQHRLYLYIPSIFIGITCTIFLNKASILFKFITLREIALLIIPCLYLASYSPGYRGYKDYWISVCKQDYNAIGQLVKIDKPANDATIYVKGANKGYSVFFYGPGNVFKLLFDDNSLKTVLVDKFPEEVLSPYILLDFSNEKITEVKRDNNKVLSILSMTPVTIDNTIFNSEGSVDIGITCNYISRDLNIKVNGKEFPTVIGKDFISTTIPRKYLENEVIEVEVIDKKHNIQSNTIKFKIK